uniref:Uncharacterized protein n=1 Tax=Setaria italica TaxID=4555 RepID=K3Z191_SETIT
MENDTEPLTLWLICFFLLQRHQVSLVLASFVVNSLNVQSKIHLLNH